ncbi:hypothetical protein BEWA_016500 [Theileria equi strain WA]|uniref:CW-type domain-containing protein n=1 Tax=Theileria equi strain WA TaxID=1537102 RepID=L1L987_THEEQ|nr:hypothetical protein BEWA_016500 [Theileria equi strain WA]EKX71972.1 hypothetical protein BEWA_016500 [Theileria equi strain WA]|eukprot:XP_004831424.1 hypothetical protein BEWA_016500 [Theileria equi strain WA]
MNAGHDSSGLGASLKEEVGSYDDEQISTLEIINNLNIPIELGPNESFDIPTDLNSLIKKFELPYSGDLSIEDGNDSNSDGLEQPNDLSDGDYVPPVKGGHQQDVTMDIYGGLNQKLSMEIDSDYIKPLVKSKKKKSKAQVAKQQKVPVEVPITTMVENWAQCENCKKWRRLPFNVDTNKLPDTWVCALNVWDPIFNSCDVPEEKYPENTTQDLLPVDPLNPAVPLAPGIHNTLDLQVSGLVLPQAVKQDGSLHIKDLEDEPRLKRGQRNKKKESRTVSESGYYTRNMRTRNMDTRSRSVGSSKSSYSGRHIKTSALLDYSYEDTSRSQKRVSRQVSAPVTTGLTIVDEDAELVKLLLNKVPETSKHPLKDRLVLYSVNLFTLLATELPHSSLFLDNPRFSSDGTHVVPPPISIDATTDDNTANQDAPPVDIPRPHADVSGYGKDDGTITLGFAYKTTWPSIDPDTSTIDSVDDVDPNLDTSRSQLFAMFPKLASQIPELPLYAQENDKEDVSQDTQEFMVTRRGKRKRSRHALNKNVDVIDDPRANVIMEQDDVLNAVYSFAKQHEENSKRYRHCDPLKVASGNLLNIPIYYPKTAETPVNNIADQSDTQEQSAKAEDTYLPLELTSTPSTYFGSKKKEAEPSNNIQLERIRQELMMERVKSTYLKRIKTAHPDIEYPSPDLKRLSRRFKSRYEQTGESDPDNRSDYSGSFSKSPDQKSGSLESLASIYTQHNSQDDIAELSSDAYLDKDSSSLDISGLLFQSIPHDALSSAEFDKDAIKLLSTPIVYNGQELEDSAHSNEVDMNLLSLPIPDLASVLNTPPPVV